MIAASRLRFGLFAAFASLGITAAFIPAVLPSAERALGADLSAAVPSLFAGLLVGVLASGPLLMRFATRSMLILGSLLQAIALVGVAWAGNAPLFIAAAAIAGFGFGLVEAAGSVSAKTVSTGSATGTLSALFGTVAVCAALTPLVVLVGARALPALGLLALVPLATIVLLARSSSPLARASAPPQRTLRGLAVVAPFAIALPLYVGVETVLSGWSATITERTLTLDPAVAALGTSAFWTLMAVGRFTAAALRRRDVRPTAILTIGTGAAALLLAVAGLLVASFPVPALLTLGLVVVLLAPSYGMIVGLALDRLDAAHSAAVTGSLVACGALGGTFVPALILVASDGPASRMTFLLCALLCAAVPLLAWWGARAPRRAGAVI